MKSDANGNILSIDRGSRYIGLAYRNERWWNIAPVGSILNDESLLFSLGDIIQRYHIRTVVIGYPKNHEDAQKRIDDLIMQILMIDEEMDILKVDEEYSSVQAAAQTGNYEKSTEEDTVAAMHILEGWMERLDKLGNNPHKKTDKKPVDQDRSEGIQFMSPNADSEE